MEKLGLDIGLSYKQKTRLTKQQKQILSGYQEVRDLYIFPDTDFNLIEDYEIKHFNKWCVKVLTAILWFA